jgi:hypothetical protein
MTSINRTPRKRNLLNERMWAAVLAYGERKARGIGVRSNKDIQRAVAEYRRGNLRPYTARRLHVSKPGMR